MVRDRTDVAGVILAAGGSARWGGSPKALLPIGGESAVDRVSRVMREVGIADVAVVLGARSDLLLGKLPPGVTAVVNREWSSGRTGSVQAGLAWAGAHPALLLWPVDHPFVRARTIDRILAASDEPLALWTLPQFEGRGGHPVVVAEGGYRAIAELGTDAPLRGLLAGFGVQVKRVPVPDPGVRMSTDTPEEYRQAASAWAAQGGDGWTDG